ncbi:hypothetical protein [Bacillus mojavensis]
MFRKCCNCKEKSSYEENIPTYGGSVKLRYCEKCWNKKQEREKLQREEWDRQAREKQKEIDKQKRYEYLKREIELVDLERRAKELRID